MVRYLHAGPYPALELGVAQKVLTQKVLLVLCSNCAPLAYGPVPVHPSAVTLMLSTLTSPSLCDRSYPPRVACITKLRQFRGRVTRASFQPDPPFRDRPKNKTRSSIQYSRKASISLKSIIQPIIFHNTFPSWSNTCSAPACFPDNL